MGAIPPAPALAHQLVPDPVPMRPAANRPRVHQKPTAQLEARMAEAHGNRGRPRPRAGLCLLAASRKRSARWVRFPCIGLITLLLILKSESLRVGDHGGSAWESNPPPSPIPARDYGFEDRGRHQPPSASARILAYDTSPPRQSRVPGAARLEANSLLKWIWCDSAARRAARSGGSAEAATATASGTGAESR